MSLGAGDERQVELVLIQRHVVAVNGLTCGLFHGRQVHYGTAHHIVLTLPLWHRLQEEQRITPGQELWLCHILPPFLYLVDLNAGCRLWMVNLRCARTLRADLLHIHALTA